MARTLLLPNLDADGAQAAGAEHISRHELVRFLGGELSPERRAALEARMAAEPAFRARVDALKADLDAEDAAFRVDVPLPRFLSEQEERKKPGGLFARLLSMRFTLGTGALVAAAAAVFFVVRAPGGPGVDDGDVAYDGLKGGARVGFFVRSSEGARFGKAGEELRPGDQIQFAVKDDDDKPAMILVGVDGKGAVTVYAAEDVASARTKGEPGPSSGPRLLPVSVVLDDATGPERFFVVYADGDVESVRRTVEDAARSLASSRPDLVESERLSLPASFVQSSVHIVKVKD